MHYNNTRTWTVIGSVHTFTFPPICGNFLLITRNFYHYGAFSITCGQYLPSLPFPTNYLHFLHLWPFPTICGHFLPFVGISYHLLAFLTIYLHFLHLWPFPTIYYGGWFVPFRIIVFSGWKGEKAPRENPPNGDFFVFLATVCRPLPGGAKGRHAKTRQNHHLVFFCVATFRDLWQGTNQPP